MTPDLRAVLVLAVPMVVVPVLAVVTLFLAWRAWTFATQKAPERPPFPWTGCSCTKCEQKRREHR